MIVEDGRENGRDGRVDGSAVDYVNPFKFSVSFTAKSAPRPR
jgi:hypothetical protein